MKSNANNQGIASLKPSPNSQDINPESLAKQEKLDLLA